jgi:prephenate dehydrogenase
VIQIHPISIPVPLAVGVVAQACTIIIYLVPVRATVNVIRREKGLGHVGMPWTDLGSTRCARDKKTRGFIQAGERPDLKLDM